VESGFGELVVENSWGQRQVDGRGERRAQAAAMTTADVVGNDNFVTDFANDFRCLDEHFVVWWWVGGSAGGGGGGV
jgi:hypothetical protein